ncbi:unnamed protein product, partial [Mesorhabditis spiculigera]
MIAALALSLALLVPVSEACFACGVCQQGMCGPPPPPPMPMCGGCSRGYSCGSYGCFKARARARSAKTLSVEEEQEKKAQLARLTPDQKFQRCCADRNLPDQCMSKCTYGTYTKATLQNMYFKLDACPMQAAADIHFCAAQGKDHSECCYRNGVTTTLSGPKCLTFCDQRPGHITQLDITYLSCYDRFEEMKSCFYYEMSNGNGATEPPVSILAQTFDEPQPSRSQLSSQLSTQLAENRDSTPEEVPLQPDQSDYDVVATAPRAHGTRMAKTFST